MSVKNEDLLYRMFGINAELLIDHAWGWEPTEIKTIKSYKPQTHSLSSGQVLMEPYSAEKARLIVREMTELLVLDLVRKRLVTKQVTLTLGYDRTSIEYAFRGESMKQSAFRVTTTGKPYRGKVKKDPYGRPQPVHAHGTGRIDRWTNSSRRIMQTMLEVFDRIIDPDLLVRRVTVVAANLIQESAIPEEAPEQLSLFVDYSEQEKRREQERKADERERKLQQVTLLLQAKFGKNAVVKGMNLEEGATTILRNGQIGGHRAGDDAEPGHRGKKQQQAGRKEEK
jgi:DNA polymerase V